MAGLLFKQNRAILLAVFALCLTLQVWFVVHQSSNQSRHQDDQIPVGDAPWQGTQKVPIPKEKANQEINQEQRQNPDKQKPLNVVVIYPDDWRHDDIEGVGPIVKTPFLTFGLATNGIRFSHNCVTTSVCWMSRASYFTGQWMSRHKSILLKSPPFYDHWNESWPHLLQQAGYYTGHVGKWQYPEEPVGGFFDHFKGVGGKHRWFHQKLNRTVYLTDVTRDHVFDFLRKRPSDKPFSLTVAFYPPKAVGESDVPGAQWLPSPEARALYDNVTIPPPYGSREKLPEFLQQETMAHLRWQNRFMGEERYQEGMKCYYALMTQVDKATKEIVGELEKQGVLNETLIIFTADNGFFHGEREWSGKWYPYQESIRVPLIIRDPRMPTEKHGTVDESLTLNVDLSATILGAAGLKPHPRMQGRDMADLYLPQQHEQLEEKPWRDEFFYEWNHPTSSWRWPNVSAVVRKDFKYMKWHLNKFEMLFNLQADPFEDENLADNTEYKALLGEMRARHEEMKLEVV